MSTHYYASSCGRWLWALCSGSGLLFFWFVSFSLSVGRLFAEAVGLFAFGFSSAIMDLGRFFRSKSFPWAISSDSLIPCARFVVTTLNSAL